MQTKSVRTRTAAFALLGVAALVTTGAAQDKGGMKAGMQHGKMQGGKMQSGKMQGGKMAMLNAMDRRFVMEAAQGGMLEVAASKAALQKGEDEKVKEFARMMVEDHTGANAELKSIAANKGVKPPAALDAKHKMMVSKMGKVSGAAFDKIYVADMVKAHKKDVSLFEKASKSCKDPDLKAFAAKTLPTLRTHLTQIQEIQQGMMGE